ncbi:dolichol-phosphate mannosyltransferase subunit 3 [Tilletiaria anomala UBC 951]|uniref:Dolichol-phosphate mannosyltransferase subunit 3 n=1 Tax=Tilletiaria anomala (strain ATCC 24038 / CBS 436.72 / UBC 951) TaxID=1037660 RepID=A0A066VWN1_TILAU|nr:dolichol-phosphate mannosyltransferase subunit 3 [Tilletiaria anomala UBC 951]KDN46147.1 dolichol-phosphate mannosyltransferase subunit 3 [Tilletiaria anomala UBC 951]
MTRAKNFAGRVAALTVLYTLLLLDIIPTPLINDKAKKEILPTLPWWALISTGSYLLSQLGWGLYHFSDTPKAYEELMVDIKEAKDFLRGRGVDVDS